MNHDQITRAAIVAEARSWIGTPHRHQASLKDVGCDCFGLVLGAPDAEITSSTIHDVPDGAS